MYELGVYTMYSGGSAPADMAVNPRRASQGATSIESESNVSRPPEETLAPSVLAHVNGPA
jgi:hypothetical protein